MSCPSPQSHALTNSVFRDTHNDKPCWLDLRAASYIPKGDAPWDLDDDEVVPWPLHPNIEPIIPHRLNEQKSVQPRFELVALHGMRNRLEFINVKWWNERQLFNHRRVYGDATPVAWPHGMMSFIQKRLQTAGKDSSDIFYEIGEDATTPYFGSRPQFEGEEAIDCVDNINDEAFALGVLTLKLRACPKRLPSSTRSRTGGSSSCSDDWTSWPISFHPNARWCRGWHGASAYALFAILHEQRLCPGPRRKYNKLAVYQEFDEEINRAESCNIWMPLFND